MPGGPELAVAYVSISASTAGLGKQIVGATDVAAGKASKSFGQKFASGAKRVLGTAAKATMVGAGVAAGAALVSGFKSATREQNFEATMKGLYKSGARAQATIEGVNKAASKSPLGYDAYQKTAETLAYMGIKGPNAIKSLKNMNAAIVASGGGSEQLERATHGWLTAINKGKVQMDSLNQISDAGIPIYDALAAHFGVTRKQLNKMVTEGKVGVDDLNQVMKNAPGKLWAKNQTAAAKATQTFGNQAKIAWNNISQSIGTALLPLLEKLTPMLSKAGDAVSGFIDGMSSGKGAGGKFVDQLQAVWSALKPLASMLGHTAKFLATHIKLTAALAGAVLAGVAAYKAYKTAAAIATGVMKGWTLAQKIAAGASKAFAGAQRLVNAAMRANPIGLIITALLALGTGLVIAYKKSKTFRKIVNGAFNAVKSAASAVLGWFTKHLVPFFTKTIPHAFGSVLSWVRKNWKKALFALITGPVGLATLFIRNHWDKITGYFHKAWNWVKGTFRKMWNGAKAILRDPISDAWDAIKKQWSNIKGGFRAGWDWLRGTFRKLWNGAKQILTHPVEAAKDYFQKILGAGGTVRNIFSKAVDAIGRIWKRVANVIRGPVNWVIKHVINALANKFNSIAKHFPGNIRIPTVAELPKFERGGTVPGARHPYGDKVLAHLAPGEEVISNRRGEADQFRADRAAGRIPAYAGGGTVWPARGQRHKHSGYPWATWAGDINVPGHGDYGNPVRAYKDGVIAQIKRLSTSYGHHIVENLKGGGSALYAHLSKILVHQGQRVQAGDLIGRVGSTGNSSGPHLHFEIRGAKANFAGASAGASGKVEAPWYSRLGNWAKSMLASPFKKLMGFISGPLDTLKSKFGDNSVTQLAAAVPKKIVGGLKDKITDFLSDHPTHIPGFEGISAAGLDLAGKANRGIVKQIAARKGWGKGAQWAALVNLLMSESGFNNTAQNPVSTAYGMFQFLDGTWSTVGGHKTSDPVKQTVYGLRYIAKRYGNPVRAWAYHRAHNSYATGTPSAAPGWALVGERGPELLHMRGGERVVPNNKIGQVDGSGGVTNNFNGPIYTVDPNEAARKIQRQQEIGLLKASLAS